MLPFLSSRHLLSKYLAVLLICTAGLTLLGGAWLHQEIASESERALDSRHATTLGLVNLTIAEGFVGPWKSLMELAASAGVVGDESPYATHRLIESFVRYNDDVLSLSLLEGTGKAYDEAVAPELEVALVDPATGERDAKILARRDNVIIDSALRKNGLHFGRITQLPGRSMQILTAAIPSPIPALDRGVLVARFSVDQLLARCSDVAVREGLDLLLADSAGRLIHETARSDRSPGSLIIGEAPMAIVATGVRDRLTQLLSYEKAATDPRAGEKVRGMASNLPELGWHVVLVEPDAQGLRNLIRARQMLVLWGLASVMTAVAAAAWLSALVARPIRATAEAIESLAEGEFSVRAPVVSRDEVGALGRAVNRLAQSFKAQQAANLRDVLREKSKTEAIVRNMADGLLVIDRDGRVGLLNTQFERWFGVPEITAVGRPRDEIIEHVGLSRHLDAAAGIAHRHVYSSNLDLDQGSDRPNQTLQARSVRVFDNRRDIVGIVTVLRDVTREKRVEQMKSDLVSTVSHELRTPLTSIQGFSEILLEEELSESEIAEFAQIISSEARRLGALINDFLDLSRIESGEIEIRQSNLNLIDLLASSTVIMEQQAATRGIEIKSLGVDREPTYLIGDRDKLEQVFVNLISNAVKYSPDGATIEIGLRSDDVEVMVEVRDEGHGIPPQYLPRIFDRFFRGDMSSTTETGGTGLGLTIVREIVERHGGNIVAKSVVGMGSSFVVTLPRFGARSTGQKNQSDAAHSDR